jgi:hypothetical protein
MQLRDYQIPAVEALAKTRRGIIKSPAGSGKTIIGAAALQKVALQMYRAENYQFKIAWIANTTDQIAQGKSAIERFPIPSTDRIDFYCYAGCPSLALYELVILDECHHIAAPEYRKILNFHEGSRWGLSATPDRADDLKNDVYELIGPIVHTVDRAPLVAAGQITEAKVFIHSPNAKGEMEKEIADIAAPIVAVRRQKWPYLFSSPKGAEEQIKRILWQAALDAGVENNQKKNSRVIQLAKEHLQNGDSVLILVGKIEHGNALGALIPGSVMVFSKMGAKKRREAIAAFGSGECRCMIATSLADEGLDVPRANVLIQVSAGRSAAKAEQRTGRVLRAFHDAHTGKEKKEGIIHDFSDLHHYFLAAQSRRRIAVYRSLGYQITAV